MELYNYSITSTSHNGRNDIVIVCYLLCICFLCKIMEFIEMSIVYLIILIDIIVVYIFCIIIVHIIIHYIRK